MINKKKGFMIFLGFAILVFVFISAYFGKSYLNGKKEMLMKEEILEKLLQTENQLSSKNSEKSSLAKDYEIALSAIPQEPAIPFFMTQLEIAAKEAGLEVRRLSFVKEGVSRDKNKKEEPVEIVGITISGVFGGNALGLSKYLTLLESAQRITEINNIRLNEEKLENGERGGFEMGLSFTGYYLPFKNLKDGEERLVVDPQKQKDIVSTLANFRFYKLETSEKVSTP